MATRKVTQIEDAAGNLYDVKDAAAQADITELKSALNDNICTICDDTYWLTEKDVSSTESGWQLLTTGYCRQNSNYKMVKYTVVAGDIVKVISDDLFQFQTSSSVPSTGALKRVGETYGSGVYFLEVPETATYLIVSTLTENSNASVFSGISVKKVLQNYSASIRRTISAVDIKKYVPDGKLTYNGITYEIAPGMIGLNGTCTSGHLVNLLGETAVGVSSGLPSTAQKAYGPYSFAEGHVYKLTLRLVSGTVSDKTKIRLMIFNEDGTNVIKEIHLDEFVIFISQVQQIAQFGILSFKDLVCTNAVLTYTFEDVENTGDSKTDIAEIYPDIPSHINSGKIIWNGSTLIRKYSTTDSQVSSIQSTRWGGTSISKELDAKTTTINNLHTVLNGGKIKLLFEQGTRQTSNGYFVNAADSTTIRTRFDCAPYLLKGDTITVADGYVAIVSKVTPDPGGLLAGSNISGTVIPEDGLYFILVRKENRGDIVPDEGYNALTINCNGVHHLYYIDQKWDKDTKSILPKNPYYKVPFRTRRSSSVPWVYGIHEVISCSHCHCETQAEFEELKQHYDHVAISNYYPSSPWYPLEARFENVGDTLGSPNAEHSVSGRFNGFHLNAVGGYMSTPTSYENGDDFIVEAMTTMKMANGGGITINHPKWSSRYADTIIALMDKVSGIIALEVWNANCEELNGKGDSSEIWDNILKTGRQIFATAVPDHNWQGENPVETYGNGYNHMLVTNASEEEVLVAYKMGRFYCSKFNDGLKMTYIDLSDEGLLSIEVSDASTYKFITATRNVEVTTAATSATFQTQDGDVYVRVEVYHGNNVIWTNAIML